MIGSETLAVFEPVLKHYGGVLGAHMKSTEGIHKRSNFKSVLKELNTKKHNIFN